MTSSVVAQNQEEEFMNSFDEHEAAASVIDKKKELSAGDSSVAATMNRLEERAEEDPVDKEDSIVDVPAANSTWGNEPSFPGQSSKYPESLRGVEPTTVVLNLGDGEDLAKLNVIQKKSALLDPQVSIITHERQQFNGGWSVYLTYEKIQYQKL